MIVAKLTISYDRGTAYNRQTDLGTNLKRGDVTADGGVVRGLGSHFRSQEDMIAAQARDKEAGRIYRAFRERFLATTVDGLYVVPAYGAAKKFIEGISPSGIEVRVAEFELTSANGLDGAELSAWGEKIKRQLSAVNLGRKKETDLAGLKVIDALADCPLMTEKTREAVKGLVGLLKASQINKADFRKRLGNLNIEIAAEQVDKAHAERVEKIREQAGAPWLHAPVAAQ